ncbi:hypothetical protein RUM44_003825 [Polyplax serrata]|uniref:Cilia- and flagella-associated protein 300 n=1 Tax=Polyplax serrata TaxID=468196 RepID=A0ABR1B145_POLSC
MEPKYNFTHLKSKNFSVLNEKSALDYFLKWSLKGQIKLTTFCFNEAFLVHQRKDFIDNFFHDAVVVSVLNSLLPNWPFNRENIVKIEAQTVPCTVSSMSFFDRIQNERNKIIRGEGNIRQCLDDVIDGFLVSDELRKMLIDEESDNFGLFLEGDRNEFIFHIFRFLVLGGKWCQYEDKINPYLELTKMLYKNLVRVEKNPESKQIEIKSICEKVCLIGKNNFPIFPMDSDHLQNFVYLIIDPVYRQVTVFAHEYGGQF